MERDALQLLIDLLEIPSVNSHDDEGGVARFVADYLNAHGVSARVQEIDSRHANVLAFVPGKNPDKTINWNGHLDTVPYGNLDEWETDPAKVTEKDGKLYARGASDMKSGLAAMVYALSHLEEAPACNIRFMGTCDEEKNGLGAQRILDEDEMKDGDWLLVGEPTGMKLGVAQKGCLWLEITVKGKTSHGAYPKEGANAIDCGVKIAEAVSSYVSQFSHSLLGNSTGQITMIEGGVANNMTPDVCRIVMDIRMTPGLTAKMVFGAAEAALKNAQTADPRVSASFKALNDRRAIEISGTHPMSAGLGAILREAGYDGGELGINFFTDASVLDREGIKQVLLFGPGEPFMAHKPNEYVEIGKYQDAIRILQRFAKECGQEQAV